MENKSFKEAAEEHRQRVEQSDLLPNSVPGFDHPFKAIPREQPRSRVIDSESDLECETPHPLRSRDGRSCVIVAYRPKPGCTADLLDLVRQRVPLVAKEGLVMERKPTVMRASDGTIIEVSEWEIARSD